MLNNQPMLFFFCFLPMAVRFKNILYAKLSNLVCGFEIADTIDLGS